MYGILEFTCMYTCSSFAHFFTPQCISSYLKTLLGVDLATLKLAQLNGPDIVRVCKSIRY